LKDAVEAPTEVEIYSGDDVDKITRTKAIKEKPFALPVHVFTANQLVNALQTLVTLERQAFNIKDDTGPHDTVNPLAEIIESIDGISKGLPVFNNEQ
jgi:hypothetical protein